MIPTGKKYLIHTVKAYKMFLLYRVKNVTCSVENKNLLSRKLDLLCRKMTCSNLSALIPVWRAARGLGFRSTRGRVWVRQKERERCTLSWVQWVYHFFGVFRDIYVYASQNVLRVRSQPCTNKRHHGPLFPTTSHLKAMCREEKKESPLSPSMYKLELHTSIQLPSSIGNEQIAQLEDP